MILVAVGNATQGFRRLLDAVEEMAGQGVFADQPVFIQSGHNPAFRSSHSVLEDFLPMERFEEMIRQADLVICHAGAGTLINVLRSGKVPVVMPRRMKYGEHVDDHQVELVRTLASEGRVIPAFEPDDLPEAVAEARGSDLRRAAASPSKMIGLVAQAIDQLLGLDA